MSTEFQVNLLHDKPCEEYVLSVLMNYRDAFDEVSDILTSETFHTISHREVFKAIASLNESGQSTDVINVNRVLQTMSSKVGMADLLEIDGKSSVNTDIRTKAAWLVELYRKRKLWEVAKVISDAALRHDKSADEIQESAIAAIGNMMENQTAGVHTFTDIMKDVYALVGENQSGTHIVGVPTGFKQIDVRGGLQFSDLIIVAAESSVGKTSFAIKMATEAAQQGYPVAFYSMEMTAQQLGVRIVSADSGVEAMQIAAAKLDETRLEYVDRSIGTLAKLPIYVDEKSTSTIDGIIRSIRNLVKRYGIRGAFVDYLQILSVNTKTMNKEQFMGDCARRLKNLAKDLNIFIVALSQFNRNQNGNNELSLNRLRDSGQIGEAADLVLMIDRPEMRNGTFPSPYSGESVVGKGLVKCVKGRKVGIFSFLVGFQASTTKFYELANNSIQK